MFSSRFVILLFSKFVHMKLCTVDCCYAHFGIRLFSYDSNNSCLLFAMLAKLAWLAGVSWNLSKLNMIQLNLVRLTNLLKLVDRKSVV